LSGAGSSDVVFAVVSGSADGLVEYRTGWIDEIDVQRSYH
jgi:hypothetical protein